MTSISLQPTNNSPPWDDDDEDNWSFDEWKVAAGKVEPVTVDDLEPLQRPVPHGEAESLASGDQVVDERDLWAPTPSTPRLKTLDPEAFGLEEPLSMAAYRIRLSDGPDGDRSSHRRFERWRELKATLPTPPTYNQHAPLVASPLRHSIDPDEIPELPQPDDDLMEANKGDA